MLQTALTNILRYCATGFTLSVSTTTVVIFSPSIPPRSLEGTWSQANLLAKINGDFLSRTAGSASLQRSIPPLQGQARLKGSLRSVTCPLYFEMRLGAPSRLLACHPLLKRVYVDTTPTADSDHDALGERMPLDHLAKGPARHPHIVSSLLHIQEPSLRLRKARR